MFSKDAKKSRDDLPADARAHISKILDELTEDPDKYPDRVIPASLEGMSFVYMHPDPAIQITYEIDREKKIIYFFHFSAPSLPVKKTIFISYSHKDKKWFERIRKFLTVLEQQELIKFWDDEQLEAGMKWEQEIEQALDSSIAGVLLVSQEFLSSKFIQEKELPKLLNAAEKKGHKIFWIHLSPSTVFDTHKDIAKFQSLMKNPHAPLNKLPEVEQEEAFVEISKRLSEVVTKH